jgi:hypothetical protein
MDGQPKMKITMDEGTRKFVEATLAKMADPESPISQALRLAKPTLVPFSLKDVR